MRTVAILVGGMLLTFVLASILENLLQPNAGPLIVRAFKTPPNSPEWSDLERQLHRFGIVTVYVVSPLVGLLVGIFVGLLERHHAMIVAPICLIPDFLFSILADRAKYWTSSFSGISIYIADHSLPFIAAMIAAAVCERLMQRRAIVHAAK